MSLSIEFVRLPLRYEQTNLSPGDGGGGKAEAGGREAREGKGLVERGHGDDTSTSKIAGSGKMS